ncbi:MAG TPA: alpha/beta hydrolase [Candidatus Angelobacter sp.]|nr:alpha/beta hydrolase [Candidatus Angelobacter sp.]
MVEAKLVPASGKHVKVNDLTIYYETFGAGEPLVLLHGGTATRRMWEKFVPTFSKHFKVIAPDSRGHGKTNNPSGEFSFRLMADDTAGLIRALGLERPSICGYSDGGQIALEFGMHHPKVASKLVIAGAHNRLQDADVGSLRDMGIEAPGVVDVQKFEKAAPEIVSRVREFSSGHGPEYWKTFVKEISKMWFTQLNYTVEDYRKITAPCLILVGDRDPDVSLEDALEMYRSIPKAELAVVPGSDHYFPWSMAQLFTSTILDFLQR